MSYAKINGEKVDTFDKRHPRNTCPRCHEPNHLPNESIEGNAGARFGVNVYAEISHPALWKASGGPGTVTSKRARLCWKCGQLAISLLTGGGFLDVEIPLEKEASTCETFNGERVQKARGVPSGCCGGSCVGCEL